MVNPKFFNKKLSNKLKVFVHFAGVKSFSFFLPIAKAMGLQPILKIGENLCLVT